MMYRVEIHNLRLGTVEAGSLFDSREAAEGCAEGFNAWARRVRVFHLLYRAVWVGGVPTSCAAHDRYHDCPAG